MILDGVSAPLQELEEAGSFESKAPTNEVNRKPLKFKMVHLKISPWKGIFLLKKQSFSGEPC